ncbi:MAG: hypothetical protein R3287_01890 [Anderseniella sp.]|nr:hypothetical protein [Anderseniella sp.]
MSASPLAKTDWDLPPEMKPQRQAARKSPSKGKQASKTRSGGLEVIVVGGSLKDASAAINAHKAPVKGRHMRSIDDLLAHIEDHDVDVAVVDQSKPTESRGLKLALLAAAKRIKHLIVIADPKNAAEAEAIHGVHEVIRAPVSDKRLLDAVITHACTVGAPDVHPSMKRMVKRTGLKEVIATPPEPVVDIDDDNGHVELLPGETHRSMRTNGTGVALDSFSGKMRQLAIPHHNRALLAALVPLFAVFICFGGIVAFFFASNGWSVPIELGRSHELVRHAGKQLEVLRGRNDELQSALDTASTLAAMAETSRRQAAQRLDVAEQAIVSERDQNARVLKETRAHISRLRRIAARSGFAEGNPGAGGLQSMHQLAMVSNELAVKEIEETRLAAREAYLKSLAEQPAGSAFRALPAASADLIVLGREASDARTAVAEASQTYAGKQVEINRLRDELKIVQAKLDDMSSTLAARAWDKPVSAVFVPDANASNYRPGMPLYSCKLLLVMCTQTGKTGQMLAESAGETHPLFGNPVSGTYVEAIMSGTAQPHGALVHAGGKPLLF